MGETRDRADRWLTRESNNPQLIVVGLPWSSGSQGLAIAPLSVRDRLGRFSTFHTERETDFGDVPVRDAGNWPVMGLDQDELEAYLASRLDELPARGLSIFIGGEDAITRAIVAATGASLIRFSAGPRTGAMEGVETVTIGAQGFGGPGEHSDTVLTNDRIGKEGMRMIVDRALSKMAMSETIHVSVDLDVLDPAFAPASPDSMPGGLDVRQLADAVRRSAANPKVSSMDLVGVDADLDDSDRTLDVVAHLLLSAATGFKERSLTP